MPYVAAGTAIVSLGAGIAQNQDQQRRASIAEGRQRSAQQQAEARAAADSSRLAEETARAKRRVPDLGALQTDQQMAALGGPFSTVLTGRPSFRLGGPPSTLGG